MNALPSERPEHLHSNKMLIFKYGHNYLQQHHGLMFSVTQYSTITTGMLQRTTDEHHSLNSSAQHILQTIPG